MNSTATNITQIIVPHNNEESSEFDGKNISDDEDVHRHSIYHKLDAITRQFIHAMMLIS